MAAQGGVFQVSIPRDAVPDDWELPSGVVQPEAYKVSPQASKSNSSKGGKSKKTSQQPMYSISG